MRFLIDTQQDKVREKLQQFPDLVLGQLLTPLTSYAYWGGQYAIDNGAFARFDAAAFARLLKRMEPHAAECKFVVCPDIVGNGRRTLELWRHRYDWVRGWPAALVLQNGIEDLDIPWDECRAIFVGGKDPWKESQACADLVKTAKALGLWVHVGRVNTWSRFSRFAELGADSCDGSGISRYDHMLESIHRQQTTEPQKTLFENDHE